MAEIRRAAVELGSISHDLGRVLYIPGGAGFLPSTVSFCGFSSRGLDSWCECTEGSPAMPGAICFQVSIRLAHFWGAMSYLQTPVVTKEKEFLHILAQPMASL